ADKVAKKRSASSRSDYQKIDRVTPSKAPMMAPISTEFEIPEAVYVYVNLVFKAEQQLKTRPSDKVLLHRLSYYKQQLGIVADLYKESNHLPSDWQYHPDTASSFKPIRCHQVPAKKEPKKNIPRTHFHLFGLFLVDVTCQIE
ncbi:hypothetical protein Tco_1322359, partial [Tanacetum coccineum]